MFSKLGSKIYYWHIFIALLVLRYLSFSFLDLFQYLYIRQTSVPANLQGFVSQSDYQALRAAELPVFFITFWESFISCTLLVVIFGFGLLAKTWSFYSKWCDKSSVSIFRHNFGRSAIFYLSYIFCLSILSQTLLLRPRLATSHSSYLTLPSFSLKFKLFRNLSWTSFILDLLLMGITTYCVEKPFWSGFSLLCLVDFITLALSIAYMYLSISRATSPSFDQAVGGSKIRLALLDQLKPLCAKLGFPLENIHFMNHTAHAFTFGYGPTTKIVVSSLLIATGLNVNQIVAVVGHELGHWYYNHLAIILSLFFVRIITYNLLIGYVYRRKSFYRSFGIHITDEKGQIPVGIALILCSYLLYLVDFFLSPLFNYMSWIFEYQADAFSAKQGFAKDLYESLIFIHEGSSKLATVSYGLFYAIHPVFSARLGALKKLIGANA